MIAQRKPFGSLAIRIIVIIGIGIAATAGIVNGIASYHRTIHETCETAAKSMSCTTAHGSSGQILALLDGLILGFGVAGLYAYLISLAYTKADDKPRQIAWTCVVIMVIMLATRGVVINVAAYL